MLSRQPLTTTLLSLSNLAALSLVALTAFAQTLTYSGTTLGEPRWMRPIANGANPPVELSFGAGANVAYSAFAFQVPTAGNYDFLSTAVTPAGWDNYFFLYEDRFDATDPLTNCLIGSDDFPTIGLSGFDGVALTTGTEYFLVTTGFTDIRSDEAGDFTNTITGPGTAFPTPAPSSAAVMTLGGMMSTLVLLRRRRK